jgi:phosphatidylglycerol lysyltransferase
MSPEVMRTWLEFQEAAATDSTGGRGGTRPNGAGCMADDSSRDQSPGRPDRATPVRRVLARVPFAVALWLAVALVGIGTGTWVHELHPARLERWGNGLGQLWQGHWWTLVTATVFVHGPAMYWAILLFIPASVGAYEWLAGTRRALFVFWATDLASPLFVAFGVALPLFLAGTEIGDMLRHANDVGMSGGGFGCNGALMHHLPRRWRRPAIGVAAAYLLVRLAKHTDVQADALHLVAFFGGFALDRLLGRDGGEVRA